MGPHKRVRRSLAGHAASRLPVEGYEIHLGATDGPDRARPFAHVDGRPEGAVSASGRIAGSYLHGLFAADRFRAAYLAGLGIAAGGLDHAALVETTLDDLAAHLERHLDMDALLGLAR